MTHLTTGVPPCVAAKKEERERERRREGGREKNSWAMVTGSHREKDRETEWGETSLKPSYETETFDWDVCMLCFAYSYQCYEVTRACVGLCEWQTSAGEPQTGPDILARSKYTSGLSSYPLLPSSSLCPYSQSPITHGWRSVQTCKVS